MILHQMGWNGQWSQFFIDDKLVGYVEKYDNGYWRFCYLDRSAPIPVVKEVKGEFFHRSEADAYALNYLGALVD